MNYLKKTIKYLVAFFILIVAIKVADNSERPNITLSDTDKITLCKSYIANIFHRQPSVYSHYKTDEEGLIYVRFIRPNDGTLWVNRCKITSENMLWSTYLKDDKKWGRWRVEDKANLTEYEPNRAEYEIIKWDLKVKVNL
ncbi:hypothetical protein [Enterovibrio norvegicus]|uniref:Uncharacterized protein n=1 Tax=Enterovibrio norvegicus TaxID=188144 RepID=A0ABV4L2F2_9GAMM|nr:hypothetical protein [Enterovibrio norvegicus]OEF57993.1 hypothetical protein A1OU_07235 [Enterovibrio norvegicus]